MKKLVLSRYLPALSIASLITVSLVAGDPSWKGKPIADWTEEDAQQVLTDSPWAKTVKANISRLQTEDERRAGGNMGQDHGVGFDGIDGKGAIAKARANAFRAPGNTRPESQAVTLQLRWESALPIRAAELKANVIEPPTLAGEGYSLAVYRVPGANFKADPKTLGAPLKKTAVLRRDGKKDVTPSSVEVFQREDGLVVVYLFPLIAEINSRDGRIEFHAQIGRLALTQYFDAGEMQFQGKPAL
jgi:hypothetical protein